MLIHRLPFADVAAVEKIARVELKARLRGEHLEKTPRRRIRHLRGKGGCLVPGSEHEGVIVAAAGGDQGVDGGSERALGSVQIAQAAQLLFHLQVQLRLFLTATICRRKHNRNRYNTAD